MDPDDVKMIEFMIDSPWNGDKRRASDVDKPRNYETYPMTTVRIETLPHNVVTSCGEIDGIATVATIKYGDTVTATGHAVYAPERDKNGNPTVEYSFEKGAKLALTRALNNTRMKKKTRASIWTGFFWHISVK